MSDLYRSGLRFRPPLGRGGHTRVRVPPPPGFDDDPDAFPETPGLWRCVLCHELVTDWQLAEGFYAQPCMGRVAAIAAAA